MQERAFLSGLGLAISVAQIPRTFAAMPLPRSTPEAQGISSQAVCEFVQAVDRINTLHSFMIVRHGKVIGEGWWKPEAPDKPHVLHSLSKSFNATAVGLAIEDGKLSLDDPVLKFFPRDAPADPSDNLKAMKVRDLLTMTCGHDTEPTVGAAPSVKQFLAHPVPHQPGTHFQYNTMGSYTLSAIVTRATTDRQLLAINDELNDRVITAKRQCQLRELMIRLHHVRLRYKEADDAQERTKKGLTGGFKTPNDAIRDGPLPSGARRRPLKLKSAVEIEDLLREQTGDGAGQPEDL
jgi:hypothetical protein